VDGPLLVIAPKGNPAIALDARLLDRIELIGRSPISAFATSAGALGAAAAGAFQILPGHIFLAAGMLYIAHERFSVGRRRQKSRDLLLALGSLEVALHVADGPAAAKRIADQLAPYSRSAPITRPEVYEDARRRLRAQVEGRTEAAQRSVRGGLTVGREIVEVRGDFLQVGELKAFRLTQVREYALRGANLPLPGGRLLQAAMGLLVVAADERARQGEDLDVLSERIAAYEKWTGRSAGR